MFKTQNEQFVDMVLTLKLAEHGKKHPNKAIKHACKCLEKRLTDKWVLGELKRLQGLLYPVGELASYKIGMEDDSFAESLTH